MTTCRSGCGSCCSPVLLPYSQAEASRLLTDPADAASRHWILHDLTPMSPKEAYAREPYLKRRTIMPLTPGEPLIPNFYSCRWFDEEQRVCTNYEGRPPACRDWPWRDGTLNRTMALPPTCSYRADVNKPVAVLPTRRQGRVVS